MFDVSILSNRDKWIRAAKAFGAGDMAEDFIHDTIIKLSNKEQVNDWMFYFALRNTVVDNIRASKKQIELINHEGLDIQKIYNYIDTFNPYDRKLYNLYIDTKLSMREISNQTGISLTSIFKTIKSCNERIKHFIELEVENHE